MKPAPKKKRVEPSVNCRCARCRLSKDGYMPQMRPTWRAHMKRWPPTTPSTTLTKRRLEHGATNSMPSLSRADRGRNSAAASQHSNSTLGSGPTVSRTTQLTAASSTPSGLGIQPPPLPRHPSSTPLMHQLKSLADDHARLRYAVPYAPPYSHKRIHAIRNVPISMHTLPPLPVGKHAGTQVTMVNSSITAPVPNRAYPLPNAVSMASLSDRRPRSKDQRTRTINPASKLPRRAADADLRTLARDIIRALGGLLV